MRMCTRGWVGSMLFWLALSGALAGLSKAEILGNGGFEVGSGHGLPPPAPWQQAYYPATAGSVTTGTAARSGVFGAWSYTYNGPLASYSRVYQDLPAQPGRQFHGAAWARTAPIGGQGTWIAGSAARLRLTFLTSGGVDLASYDSEPLTAPGTGWTELQATTDPAPASTAIIRFVLLLEKPSGPTGQSVGAFDDGSLGEIAQPVLAPSAQAFGFGLDRTLLGFAITNLGSGELSWTLVPDTSWIALNPTSGTTTIERDTVVITASRTGLPVDRPYHGRIAVLSNGGEDTLDVYMENYPTPSIPPAPSVVMVDGARLLVRKRLPDGSLDLARPYELRGAAWSPASVGTTADRWDRLAEFEAWYRLDLQMLREMNANTVYVFLDFGLGEAATQLLDYLYLNGLMAIVTVDWDGTFDEQRVQQVVTAYRNHPAILCWAVGNEWNINFYHGRFDDLMSAAEGTEQLATAIHALDQSHPVATIFGEIDILPDQPLAVTRQIVNDICPSVDLWGCNIYRGPSFGNLFQQWASISTKPMFLSEYGADSFHSTNWWPVQGYVDETEQADFNQGLWREISDHLSCCYSGGVCVGGAVFEWCDEWWKTGSPLSHEPDGYEAWWNPNAFPDGFANEEYFGLVNLDRTVKQSFGRFRQDYATSPSGPCAVLSPAGADVPDGRSVHLRCSAPTPLRPTAITEFTISLTHGEWVDVQVFNVRGRRVRMVFGGLCDAGTRAVCWDLHDDEGQPVPSGVYLVRATTATDGDRLSVVLVR